MDLGANQTFAGLPAGSRRIVTSHDAFGYLGQAHGIEFIAPQGLTTEREPSARSGCRADGLRVARSEPLTGKIPSGQG